MTKEEASNKYLEYLEGHIGNVKEAFNLFCTLDIPFIKENEKELAHIMEEHDLSKYDEPEWTAYIHHFYPTCNEDSLKTEEFEQACRHHIQNNPHHWDYWVIDGKLMDDIDEHEYKLYCVERCADWAAMGIQNNNSPLEWYLANKENIIMPDYGYELCEEILKAIPKDYDLSFHGTRNDGKPERDMIKENLDLTKTTYTEEQRQNVIAKTKENMSNHRYAKYIDFVSLDILDDIKDYDREIRPNQSQESFEELFNAILANGITEPGFIVYNPNNGHLKLGEGNHRLLICKILKLDSMPVWCSRSNYMEDGVKYVNPENITPYCLGALGENIYADPMNPKYLGEPFGPNFDGNTYLETLNEDIGLNREYIKKLGKRAKRSKTSNTAEINTSMTNHDRQLDEYGNSGYVGQSKSVRAYEAEDNDKYTATECDKLLGVKPGATKACLVPSEWHHTGSYYKETDYYDIRLLLAIKDNDEEVISEYDEDEIKKAKESLEELKSWRKPELTSKTYKADVEWLTWSGTRKHPKATKHSVKNTDVEERGSYYYFNDEYGIPTKKMIGSNGTYVHKLDESTLNEAKASQLRNKTKMEDPARVKKSRNVKTTYIGMSKFGVLNFKTTSESRSGYHYQTIEFQSLKPFEDIIKKNGEIMPMDVKNIIDSQDINVYCSDESFTYWAWYHQAYQNDYAYIDDAIPDLNKRLQAPKVNNVRLAGALCKHLYSVLDYIMKPFVLLAISEDMNNFLNKKQDKYSKQTVATQNWYDAVKQWTSDDAQEYLGLTREQIIMDLSKTIKVDPEVNLDDFVDDLVKDAIAKNKKKIDPKLERDIVDRVIDELNLDDEYNKLKPEEVEDSEENIE